MKNVDIISKVVARKGEAMASPSKGAAPSVDLSGYLLKEIWDRIFEIRSTENGEEYIFCKTSLAAQGGLTMYVDGGLLNLPSIYDGLPIDGKTLFWEEENGVKLLKARGGEGGGIAYPLSWSGFSSGSYDGTSAKTIYIPSKVSELSNDSDFITSSSLNGYATESFVTGKGYITASALNGYATESWVNNKGYALASDLSGYVTELGLESNGKYDQYLTYTKGGTVNKLTVGYASYANSLLAWGTTDLNASGVWNTNIGLKSCWAGASASNLPVAAGTNANGVITFMPVTNYGFQLAYLNQLSTGYDTIPHLFFRNYVNGSYKSWHRIVTDGPQMQFQGIDWNNPYMRMRYQTGSWYYVQMRSDGMWLGLSNTNGVRIDVSGNLLATGGVTMYGTSDQRLKQNIRTFSASEELMKLGGVYQFEYIEEEIKRNVKYRGTHFGLIYQNVKESSLSKMCIEREDGFGALNYLDTSFISLLAAVGMEHETRLQRLERENKELKAKIEELERR